MHNVFGLCGLLLGEGDSYGLLEGFEGMHVGMYVCVYIYIHTYCIHICILIYSYFCACKRTHCVSVILRFLTVRHIFSVIS